MTSDSHIRNAITSLSGFDYFVLAGAAVNLVVITCLVGFWLFAGQS
jgi:hypothetical protein